jgi:hypothetical protein
LHERLAPPAIEHRTAKFVESGPSGGHAPLQFFGISWSAVEYRVRKAAGKTRRVLTIAAEVHAASR